MLKLDLILRVVNYNAIPLIDHYQKERVKKFWLMKNELGEKIVTKFVGLRAKTYSYLIDDSSEDKIAKGAKNCVIKRKLKLKIIKTV